MNSESVFIKTAIKLWIAASHICSRARPHSNREQTTLVKSETKSTIRSGVPARRVPGFMINFDRGEVCSYR